MTATILFVDDEPDLEDLVLQKFRKRIGEGEVSFVFAHDGVEALQSLELNPNVDMVISDINMPRMDGLSLLERLQATEDKTALLAEVCAPPLECVGSVHCSVAEGDPL